jgi:8-oxo-dGTP pyrophosphatase MutT (NUDIX family)/phosphohistidine phosphatase SixA
MEPLPHPSQALEPIRAAGVVALREQDGITEVLIVHRNRDLAWSLPKGKVEPNEHPAVTAVRECDEETGLQVRLGPPLDSVSYLAEGQPKTVQYWVATCVGDVGFTSDEEVDEISWCPQAEALELLAYPGDRGVVEQALGMPRTVPLIILRHARAMKRADFKGKAEFKGKADAERPLTGTGRSQAKALVPLMDAYGITRVVTSDAERCTQTVRRYAKSIDARIVRDHAFSEEGHAARSEQTRSRASRLAVSTEPTVLCTHRPVLPTVLAQVAIKLGSDPEDPRWEPRLRPGGGLVIHRSMRPDGSFCVQATERHEPFAE